MSTLESQLQLLADGPNHFTGILRGLEKENLRVNKMGELSSSDHPQRLGKSQTHAHFTTDFAENLLEVVTPPLQSIDQLLGNMTDLLQYAHAHCDGEYLWPYSMPCYVPDAKAIRIAEYGNNNSAKMKQVYRKGLSLRYGMLMQIIAGMHYNFSLPAALFATLAKTESQNPISADYISTRYFGAIRNYFRYYWILPYLFGASPFCMKSSIPGVKPDCLREWDSQALLAEYATSLRMSGIGYHNKNQNELYICHNNLTVYAKSLLQATQMPYADFMALGIKDEQGNYQQLNGNVLQIENEYYSPIRPKHVVQRGERPAVTLLNNGVQYIEVRVLDLNPYLPLGVDAPELAFLDIFLLACVLMPSDQLSSAAMQECRRNFSTVAAQGRAANLQLSYQSQSRAFTEWAHELLAMLQPVADLLAAKTGQAIYQETLALQKAKLVDPALTPSGKMVAEMQQHKLGLQEFALMQAEKHQRYFAAMPRHSVKWQNLDNSVEASIAAWQKLEQDHSISFEQYLAAYFEQGVEHGHSRRLCD